MTTRSEATQAASLLDRRVSRLSLRLVTFGLGDMFNPEKFDPIKNRQHLKPSGGLWASPVGCSYGWKDWSEDNNFGDLSSCFATDYVGRTLVIDSVEDLAKMQWQEIRVKRWGSYPDYEAMLNSGIDAIYVTERGEQETRFSDPGLYGYDCECVIVLNGACLKAANV